MPQIRKGFEAFTLSVNLMILWFFIQPGFLA